MQQITSANFSEIVQQAYSSPSAEVRTANEAAILQFIKEQTEVFVTLCSNEFRNTALNPSTRVAIATLVKVALRPTDPKSNPSIWSTLSSNSKNLIKSVAIECLIDQNDAVKKAAASLTAVVFVIDSVTDKEWGGLLSTLVANIENPQITIKKAAITTMGYICELLNADKINNLPNNQVEEILGGICIGLRSYSEVSNTAVIAMANSIRFLKQKIEDDNLLTMIFDLLVTLLIASTNAKDAETTRNILLLLGEIAKLVFDRFGKYSTTIFQKVLDCYLLRDSSVTLAVNEFFMKLVKAERQKHTQYFAEVWQNILTVVLEMLFVQNSQKSEDDEEESISRSIVMLMTSINGLYPRPSFEFLIGIVAKNIDSQAENAKLTALMVFESVLENSPNVLVYDPLNSTFFLLLTYLSSGSKPIREATASLFIKVAQFHPNIFLNDQNFAKAIPEFTKILSNPSNSEHINSLKFMVCDSLRLITEKTAYIANGPAQMAPYIDSLFKVFYLTVHKSTSLHLIDKIFETIFEIIHRILNSKNYNEYLNQLTEFLGEINSNYQGDPQNKKAIISFIFININVIIEQMSYYGVALRIPGKDDVTYLTELYTYVTSVFTFYKEILSEGLELCGAIFAYKPGHFYQGIEQFMTQYLFPSLMDSSNYDLFKAGLYVAGIISKNFKQAMQTRVEEMVNYLLTLLGSTTLIKELRPKIFQAIADFSIIFTSAILPHVDKILLMIRYAYDAVVFDLNSTNPDIISYNNELKQSIIDCYQSLIYGVYLETDIKDQAIEESFIGIQEYIKITCLHQNQPSLDYLKTCLGTILDCYRKKRNRNTLNIELTKYLYDFLAMSSNIPEVQELLDYAKELMSTF